MISLITAHDINCAIGLNGNMPWGKSIKSDLEWFRKQTTNKVVVMGSRTFESIGNPLLNRINVVLTKDESKAENYRDQVCYVAHSIEEILSEWTSADYETMIIGGSEIYRQFLPYADRLYITHIDYEFDGDTYFPKYDLKDYVTVYKRKEENGAYGLDFRIYEKTKRNIIIDT